MQVLVWLRRGPGAAAAAFAIAGAALAATSGVHTAANPAVANPVVAKPGPIARPVSYLREVHPLLQARCAMCHGNGSSSGGFKIDSRDTILKSGTSGPAVVAGDAAHSLLIRLVSGLVPGKVMPAQGPRLTAVEIAMLRDWIDQKLPMDAAGSASSWRPPLEPRRPRLPAAANGSGLSNPIDLLLQPYFKAHRIHPGAVVSDRVYARRVYLDLIGLLPTPAELNDFLVDRGPSKRERLARKLLDDNREYAEHWLSFWNDLLRNDYTGTGYIDGGRKPITRWLYSALAGNMPFDRFVSQLVSPTPESEGFTKGIEWRGVVNASQTPEMQAAQNISQVFMGVNLKCASCHNSFVSDWKLADSYGMAGIYSEHALEMVRCDKPTGRVAAVKFLYPQLGGIAVSVPRSQRLEQLAAVLTSKRNGRLSRTFVNRIWTRLLGRGLVEPNDEMDNRTWNPDLLDWLASDFQDRGYDVQKTIVTIVTSRAYQLPSAGLATESAPNYVFAGPALKRMTAEQFVDAVTSMTGDSGMRRAVDLHVAAAATGPSPGEPEPVRASLAVADPLTTALGRPNREQVVTERSTVATTLQALELTNGATLEARLERGASRWTSGPTQAPDALVDDLFARALGRPPTAAERALAVEEVGSPARKDGVEDLLWTLVMLPEFQLIH